MSENESTLAEQDEEQRKQGLPPVGYEPPDDWVQPPEIELERTNWISTPIPVEEDSPPAA